MTAPPHEGVLPLEGITVVDLTQVVAGPFATMVLGDLGARIWKIEAVGRGDRARAISPKPEYFDTLNRNKRSIGIDLKQDEGRAVAKDMVAEADVLIESMKPGRMERFELDYESVRDINSSVIYCSISGFGDDSPYREMPSWDMLIQAMSGIMGMTGQPDGPPVWSGLPSGDLSAAMYAVESVLAALFARERGQIETEFIEIPMLDSAISWLTSRAGHTFGFDEPFPRTGLYHPTIAPFGVFECADDPIVVAAGTDSLWEPFCEALGRTDLLDDERFESLDDRVANREAMRTEVEPIFASESSEEWIERLREAGVPAGPIHDTQTVWSDEHVKRRGLRTQLDREGEQVEVIANPVRFDQVGTSLRRAPPELCEGTDDVLEQLSYSAAEIRELQQDGAVE